jgi:hypothetical protein
MLICPQCSRKLSESERQCPKCRTDLSLLVDYVENLRVGLREAELLTRRGELGEAVWKYLEVLEVDPDNKTARRQVGKVATAVRHFDQASPARDGFRRLRRGTWLRRWWSNWNDADPGGLVGNILWFILVCVALMLGYYLGTSRKWGEGTSPSPPPTDSSKPIEPSRGAEPAGGGH